MDTFGDELLARTAFAYHEHRFVQRRQLRHLIHHAKEGGRGAEHACRAFVADPLSWA